ncbi:MAG: adenosylcobinamide amidohydrolase, partial [Deltaproteobacteria bacterium]|nr:adenosylcobinamide amidohydrolase [Deltaproteobacteria bacterium]
KTAALQDLDIRSSYTPQINQATGTGTDNIIVVEGTGKRIDNAGGHSKMGELIARAVYKAVQEAVYKQNGIVTKRNIFQRLKDRSISVYQLISGIKGIEDKGELVGSLEELLLQPRYASFLESALALSDNYERGLIADLKVYELWCKRLAEEIADKKIEKMLDLVNFDDSPRVLRMSLNAILNGLFYRLEKDK